jgi:nitroreductase
MTSGNNFQILKEIILKRKAIRVFDRKKIPSVELEKVCQIAMCAPS